MRTLVLGASGLIGSEVTASLLRKNKKVFYPDSKQLNLKNYEDILSYLKVNEIDNVYLCAAKVGGILANKENPVDFFQENMIIGMNVIKASYYANVKKLINLGSTCIYPKDCPQPMKEEFLLTGELEPTNEAYALAKISTLKLCEYYNRQFGTNFVSVMPTNIYGTNDNFNPKTSHALPSMIRKIHEAKVNNVKFIEVWGDGTPIREFMYVEDLSDALLYIMDNYDSSEGIINIGTGKGETISDLYKTVMKVIGYEGELRFDLSKPNGTPIKICDITKLNNIGWKSNTSLEDGILKTYNYLKSINFKWKEK